MAKPTTPPGRPVSRDTPEAPSPTFAAYIADNWDAYSDATHPQHEAVSHRAARLAADGSSAVRGPSGSPTIPAEWMQAGLRGERRDLGWYLARAEQGDQKAALRALALCEASLSDQALSQNNWRIGKDFAAALRCVLASSGLTGDSKVLRVARGKKGGRGAIERDRWARWWQAYDMLCLMQRQPRLSMEAAASAVLDDPLSNYGGLQPNTLAKDFRKILPELLTYFYETTDVAGVCGPWCLPPMAEPTEK